MPHGGPDWGTSGPLATVYTVEDMAELAARLKSPDVFDRRGNIIFMDSFEDGIDKWLPTGGAGGGVDWEGNHAHHGGFCLKLYTDDDEGDSYQIARHGAYPVLSRIGFEIACQLKTFIAKAKMSIILYDGVLQHWGHVYYDRVLSSCWYQKSGGGMVELEGAIDTYHEVFNIMKLVVDGTKNEYVRLIFNNKVFDMSGIPLWSFGSLASPHLYMSFAITNNSDNVAITYVDSAIITQNEPAQP